MKRKNNMAFESIGYKKLMPYIVEDASQKLADAIDREALEIIKNTAVPKAEQRKAGMK